MRMIIINIENFKNQLTYLLNIEVLILILVLMKFDVLLIFVIKKILMKINKAIIKAFQV